MAHKYRLLHTGYIERSDDSDPEGPKTFIPPDESNPDYKEFLAWQEEQEAPLEPEPGPVIDPTATNGQTLRDQAQQGLQANRDFLALATPTNAQVVAQVQRLTRQNIKLIRLVLGLLDGTD